MANAPTEPQAQTQTEAQTRRQKAHRRADQRPDRAAKPDNPGRKSLESTLPAPASSPPPALPRMQSDFARQRDACSPLINSLSHDGLRRRCFPLLILPSGAGFSRILANEPNRERPSREQGLSARLATAFLFNSDARRSARPAPGGSHAANESAPAARHIIEAQVAIQSSALPHRPPRAVFPRETRRCGALYAHRARLFGAGAPPLHSAAAMLSITWGARSLFVQNWLTIVLHSGRI